MYYHVTPTSNLESIIKNGLQPSIGERSLDRGENEQRIYLFTSKQACEDALSTWLGECFENEEPEFLTILEIDPAGITGISEASFEIACCHIISASFIIAIYDEFFLKKIL